MKCIRCEGDVKVFGIAGVLMCKGCIELTVKEAVIKAKESVDVVVKEEEGVIV